MSTEPCTSLVETLARLSPFDALPRTELERLAAGARVLRVRRQEILSHFGGQPDGLYLVLDGEVKRFLLSAGGIEKVIQLVGAGETFGEEAALLGRAQPATCQATRDSTVVLIGLAPLRAAMASCAQFDAALLATLSARMYALLENLQVCMQRTSTQRVAHYLAQLAPHEAERCDIHLDTDKQTIAAQLNLTPETLSRALSRLTRDGVIRPRGRRGLTLTDVGMLRACAAN
ncbi:Crp/Fnr family transcriptional regulator [Pseudothauera nasutitermitis]|uniref:Crp/Fnr family transcriptional regulator n=1 Tax=Pseudothauera nasutitermitis TaxID=2565930 RepID=A0A4S4ANA4_9RHOO|nr:Crp/Fnr family transcriptional regulator [Pseudothauera nasutitermitis]THF61103.1 Crp/Fnr family transcriptional regulator [Pseudothauera nasutitermitis]